jgi:hypothetical protein
MKIAENILRENDPQNEGLKYDLNTAWVLYSNQKAKADVAAADGTISWVPYPIIKFSTIAGFWYTLTHEFHKMQHADHYVQYTFMREGCEPRWESYPKGGYIAYSTNERAKDDNYVLLVECLMALIGEQICTDPEKGLGIKGLTVCEEDSFFQLRFWLGNISVDIERITLSDRITSKFEEMGININNPHYKYFYLSKRKQKSNEDLNLKRHKRSPRTNRRQTHPTPQFEENTLVKS